MRDLSRDRHTVIYSVLLPLFLYPALVWGALQVVLYARGIEERLESRVLVAGTPHRSGFIGYMKARTELKLVAVEKEGADEALRTSDEAAREWIRDGTLHAVVVLEAGSARVIFSAAKSGSVKAKERLEKALEDYRGERLLDAVRSAGKDESLLELVSTEEKDLASKKELANYIAALILPLLMVVMTAMGALYPALDTTVSEKERSTLETTLVSPARRLSTVLGKYLAVVSFSLLSFFLNIASMTFTLLHLEDQLKLEGFSLGLGSAVVIVLGAILLSLSLSAAMMLLGFMARSFKEGQAYVTPVYLVSVLPAIFVSSPDAALTPGLAALPLVNLCLLFREALQGRFQGRVVALTLVLSTVYAALTLAIATALLKREAFATSGSLSFAEMKAALWPGRVRQPISGKGGPDDPSGR
jgi:sodium transport system permease protein